MVSQQWCRSKVWWTSINRLCRLSHPCTSSTCCICMFRYHLGAVHGHGGRNCSAGWGKAGLT